MNFLTSQFYTIKKLKFIFCIPVLLLAETAYSQTLSSSKAAGFECEIVIDIYNGLKDWSTGVPYSGGQLLMEDKKKTQGAVTVANFNNTDGDLDASGNGHQRFRRPQRERRYGPHHRPQRN